MVINNIAELIANKNPALKLRLKKAGYSISAEDFIKKIIKISIAQSLVISFLVFVLTSKTSNNYLPALISFFIFLPLMYKVYLYQPQLKIKKIEREIDKEIVFAGRYIIVELESGISIYDAMKNTINAYPIIGKYFRQIIDKVDMGITIKRALNEVIEITPSNNFRRILWQILNSLKTGTNVARSINSVIELIVKEQMISLNEYSKKLNPLAMFYMIIAVIFPTLGVTVGVVFAFFLGFDFNLFLLIIVAIFIGMIQFFFYGIIKNQRPAISM